MKRKNAGFTLIELVISMAILAVLGTAIGSFVYTSIKQYHAASSEVWVQTEAQAVQNQIQNLLIDATKGISADASELRIYDYNPDASAGHQKEKVCISYVSADKELLYAGYQLDESGGTGAVWKPDDAGKENFAANVTAFSVTLYGREDASGNRKLLSAADAGERIEEVAIHISYQMEQRKYESDFVVSPRNQVVVMDKNNDSF